MQIGLYPVVKNRARQGIGDGDAEAVRQEMVDHLYRHSDVFLCLAGVAELDEERGPDTVFAKQAGCFGNLSYGSALVHRIEDLLRAALPAHPAVLPAGAGRPFY